MRKTLEGFFALTTAVLFAVTVNAQECAVCGGTAPETCSACAAAADVSTGCAACGKSAVACDACSANVGCAPAGICGLEYNGYINAGGMFNDHGQYYNVNHANSTNELGFDGAYLSVLKKAQNGCGCMDWGFGADTMFGRDARFFSSYTGWDSEWETGHNGDREKFNGMNLPKYQPESYGFAMPQLYGELSYNYWTFKGGRFYTLMGYEGARADQRFFYSFGRNFEATPITHSGALATYKGIENLELTTGWVAGENNMFEREYDESLITGGVKLHRGDQASIKYAFLAGDGVISGTKGTLFRNDVVFEKKLNCCWDFAFMFNYGSLTDMDTHNYTLSPSASYSDLLAIYPSEKFEYQTWAAYLYYTMNDCWKLGARFEWQKATASVNKDNPIENGMEAFTMTYGAHWTPLCCDNFVVRPEIRYDTCTAGVFGDLSGKTDALEDQLSLGFDVLYMF